MSKETIIEGNANDKDNVRALMVKGERGYSAYELYVQGGGTLTQEQWLDEFLNAENFYNKAEVDAKNDSQDTAISNEGTARENADINLQGQINDINEEQEIQDKFINSSIFIDGIVTSKNYDATSNTTYYITEIPYEDTEGNQNKWKLGLPHDDETLVSSETPVDFATRKYASVCINGGIGSSLNVQKPHGVLIKDGVILKSELYVGHGSKILGIKEDGSFMTFDAATTNAQTVLNAGCVDALVGWDTIIENGVATSYAPGNGTEVHPRQVIARKTNGDYLIFTCNGRELDDVGMTVADMQRILLARGDIQFAYNLDGGGSTSTVVDMQKINKNIDNHSEDREVYTFLYMQKTISKEDMQKIYALVGRLSKEVAEKTGELKSLSGLVQIFSDGQNPELEYYINKDRTNRIGRIRLNEYGLNIAWTPPATEEVPEPEEITLVSATDKYLRYLGVPFGEFMNYCTNDAENTDLNDITHQGFYIATADTLNVPKGVAFLIIHMNAGENLHYRNQIAIPVANNAPIYARRKMGSSAEWGDWVPINVCVGNTNGRPSRNIADGTPYFDTTIGKPIWYYNGNWIDATGTQV